MCELSVSALNYSSTFGKAYGVSARSPTKFESTNRAQFFVLYDLIYLKELQIVGRQFLSTGSFLKMVAMGRIGTKPKLGLKVHLVFPCR